mgnify:CR=1 FL=1
MKTHEAQGLLDQERDRLVMVRNRLEWDQWAVSDDDDSGIGADAAQVLADDEERATLLDEVVAELAEVNHAYDRLRNGTFGTCETCGEPIEAARLAAVPAARCCLGDEERLRRGSLVRP